MGRPGRRRSGNTGQGLQQTAAPTVTMQARRAQVRKPQPVAVRLADGTVNVVPASRFSS